MYSIHNRDDLENLKNLQDKKSFLRKKRLKEELGKQDFHYDMEEVFEPVTARQEEDPPIRLKLRKLLLKSNYRHYVILHWLFKKVATHCKNQIKKEYKSMMKLRIAIFKFL